ncbi:MAG TPA: hypothetical protein VHC63_05160 [Acidimicrobiales bacterium]|nr:hypothetical protein [Acidimicrobiales bacterium]
MRRVAVGAAAVACILVGLPTPARSAAAPPNLAAADALAVGTPAGLVTRIPNELDGGVLYSRSTYTLDKSQAIVAGVTPGPLGEAFLETTVVAPPSVPPQVGKYVAYKNPSLVTAQYPPSNVFPAEASVADGGLIVEAPFKLRAGSLTAKASPVSADAAAVSGGQFVIPKVVTVQHAGGDSDTHVLDDGTVVAEAHSYLSGINIAGILDIASIDSVARTTAKPGATPTHSLSISIGRGLIAGMGVTIDTRGVHLAGSTVADPARIAAVNAALKALDRLHIAVAVLPGIDQHADDRSAAASGAALSIRYDVTSLVPPSVDTPAGPVGSPLGDVGKDEEVLLGQVQASSLAAARRPIADLPPSSNVLADTVEQPAPVDLGNPVATAPVRRTGAPLALASPRLAKHVAPPGVDALRGAYGLVLLCAFVTVGALQVIRRRANAA